MRKGWSDSDKGIVKAALDRARKRAVEETLQAYRDREVNSLEQLWEMELQIRQWRRELGSCVFNFSYEGVEEQLREFLKLGWTHESDLNSLSEERFEKITNKTRELPSSRKF